MDCCATHPLATSIDHVESLEGIPSSMPNRNTRFSKPQSQRDGQAKLCKEPLWTDGCFKNVSGKRILPVHGDKIELLEELEESAGSKAQKSLASFVASIRECTRTRDLHRGSQLHDDIAKMGLVDRCSDALISMYVKCGAIETAKLLLEVSKTKNVASWTSLIVGTTRQGKGREAIEYFEKMQLEGISPDAVTFASLLRACGSIKAVEKGNLIHEQIARQGLLANDTFLGNALIDMYAKCGDLVKAKRAFDQLPSKNVVSWNTIIAAYTQHGQGEKALRCFERMKRGGTSPDEVTYACVVKACSLLKAIDRGVQIHNVVARQGLLKYNPVLGTALVDMYANCGNFGMAQNLLEELAFHDVVLWNSLIGGYAKQGCGTEALKCFNAMKMKNISPNAITFTCVLKACAASRAVEVGRQIHSDIANKGLLMNNIILGTALVDMYAKCGELAKAQEVLEGLESRSVVSWSALITGYAQHGQGEKALSCFEKMQLEGISPDRVTFISVLKACGIMKAVDKGNQIYDHVVQMGLLKSDIILGTAVIDMYVKCGALAKAKEVLNIIPFSNVVSWNSLITGYSQQGQGKQAFDCFEQMKGEGIQPDAVTFACMLKVCGNMKALDRGLMIHEEIVRLRMLETDIVLGTALVDMYVKCGELEKGRKALETVPCRNVVTWNALMGGYVEQGQAEEALLAFEQMQMEGISPDSATFSYVLSSCSHLGLLEDGHAYFTNMSTKHGLKPQLEHYSCMVDLYGRAGQLDKALTMIHDMPSTGDSPIMSALLGACRKWGDVKVAKWAFEKALHVDESEGGAYVLMSNLQAVGLGVEKFLETTAKK